MEKEFRTQSELFKYLVTNKSDLISLKKSALKFTDVVSYFPETSETVTKAKYPYLNDEEKGVLKRTIIGNTYNWMDSHSDVHLSGIFTESIKQKGTKIFHLNSHMLDFSAKIGKPTNVYEKEISWRELGQGKTGMTEALFIESEIRKTYNETLYNAYLNDEVDQHSVGMQYVKIALAVNDGDEYPKEYEEWQKHIGKIGNRQKAEAQGYFWAVYEAKLVEVSAVLLGSNELTPTLGHKTQPTESLSFKVHPPTSSRKELLEAINKLSTLINN
jgi:hypothetical protein